MKYTGYYIMNNKNEVIELFDYYINAKKYIKEHADCYIEKVTMNVASGQILNKKIMK